jgi:hypothetical protein
MRNFRQRKIYKEMSYVLREVEEAKNTPPDSLVCIGTAISPRTKPMTLKKFIIKKGIWSWRNVNGFAI